MIIKTHDPKKKINLEITVDQLNDLGNCVGIVNSLALRDAIRAGTLLKILLRHTPEEEIFKLGKYLQEVATREDPV